VLAQHAASEGVTPGDRGFRDSPRQALPNQLPVTPHASEWRNAVTDPVALSPIDQSPRFIVIFPLPLSYRHKDLFMNINHVLVEPRRSEWPLIHFKSTS
jgi:hypothetical protein